MNHTIWSRPSTSAMLALLVLVFSGFVFSVVKAQTPATAPAEPPHMKTDKNGVRRFTSPAIAKRYSMPNIPPAS